MKLHRWDPKWGELTEETFRRKLQEGGFRVARYVYPPGTRFAEHSHEMDKKDGVLTGRFRVRAGDRDFVLGPGDFVEVPAGTAHSAEVIGDKPVVSLDASKRGPQ